MIIERPVRNAGQGRAPRQSVEPFQRGGPSPGNSVSRTVEWMPSAPTSTSARMARGSSSERSVTRMVTPSSSAAMPVSRWPVRIASGPRRSRTAFAMTPWSIPRWIES